MDCFGFYYYVVVDKIIMAEMQTTVILRWKKESVANLRKKHVVL